MKKENPLYNVPVVNYPKESPKEVNKRVRNYDRMILLASTFGVDLTAFDIDALPKGLFKDKDEAVQYEKDCTLLQLYLMQKKPIPQDLMERLIIIRDRRAKLEGKTK